MRREARPDHRHAAQQPARQREALTRLADDVCDLAVRLEDRQAVHHLRLMRGGVWLGVREAGLKRVADWPSDRRKPSMQFHSCRCPHNISPTLVSPSTGRRKTVRMASMRLVERPSAW